MMKQGKISESILRRSVLKYIDRSKEQTGKGAGVGEDCAFLTCGSGSLAVSTQTFILPVTDAVKYALYAAVNNLAAGGSKAEYVTLAFTLPEELPEPELQQMMKQAQEVCRELEIQIIGGHTEVSDKVKAPVITVTALGAHLTGEKVVREADRKIAQNNLDIVMTKWIGLEGTAILAKEKEKELLMRYPGSIIYTAQGFDRYLSLLPEAATAVMSGVYTMHDVRNGGVFGALYELAKRMGVGLSIDLKQIPVKQETIEICEFFDINPYELLSGGSLLIVTADGEKLVEALYEKGVEATVIGKTTAGNDKVVLNEDEMRYLEPAKPDEILKIDFMSV